MIRRSLPPICDIENSPDLTHTVSMGSTGTNRSGLPLARCVAVGRRGARHTQGDISQNGPTCCTVPHGGGAG